MANSISEGLSQTYGYSLDTLFEDMHELIFDYINAVILEDVSATSDDETKEKKDSILKKIWNTIVKIFEYIKNIVVKFVKRVIAWFSTLKTEKCIVTHNCDVLPEIISGVDSVVLNSAYSAISDVGKINDDDAFEDAINNLRKSLKMHDTVHIKQGDVLHLNTLKYNLNKLQNKLEDVNDKIKSIGNKLDSDKVSKDRLLKMEEAANIFKRYLEQLVNEFSHFINNCIEPYDKDEANEPKKC